jgi:hypothetical protein
MAVPSLYKVRGLSSKQKVCAICVERTRGATDRVSLGHGVEIWLCKTHGSPWFRARRGGRDLALTLQRLWQAHGCLTEPRRRALDAHLQMAGRELPSDPTLPGSYAWPKLRQEAERRWAAGETRDAVIDELRRNHERDYARVPSIRSMRRWYHDGRWLDMVDIDKGDDEPDTAEAPGEKPPPGDAPSAPVRAKPTVTLAQWISGAEGSGSVPFGIDHGQLVDPGLSDSRAPP